MNDAHTPSNQTRDVPFTTWTEEATAGLATPVRAMIAAEIDDHLRTATNDSVTPQDALMHLGTASQAARTYRHLYPRRENEQSLMIAGSPYTQTGHGLLEQLWHLSVVGVLAYAGMMLLTDHVPAGLTLASVPLLYVPLHRLHLKRVQAILRRDAIDTDRTSAMCSNGAMIVACVLYAWVHPVHPHTPPPDALTIGVTVTSLLLITLFATGVVTTNLDSRNFTRQLAHAQTRGLSIQTLHD